MSPSEEKRTSFWVRERRIKSFVAGQVMVFVRDWVESHPVLWGVSLYLLCVERGIQTSWMVLQVKEREGEDRVMTYPMGNFFSALAIV